MSMKNDLKISFLLIVLASAIEAHSSEIFKRHSMPSPFSLSRRLGRKVEHPITLSDAATVTPEAELEITSTSDKTTVPTNEIDETDKVVVNKERVGKQNIDLQSLSTYYPQQFLANLAKAPKTSHVLTVSREDGVLVDQLGNKYKINEGSSLIEKIKDVQIQHENDLIIPEDRKDEKIDEIKDDSVNTLNTEATGKDVKCVEKVMQVEETVYDNAVKCTHSFTEKCHKTFITDYAPTQEEKCSTSFEKNCHITYQPMAFDEKVEICDEPLKKICNATIVGEEVCRTEYETSCETRLKKHTVEQDEPDCKMVMERKCEGDDKDQVGGRRRRSIARIESGEVFDIQAENCEEWPVQRCTLEKKTVTKSTPQTSCQKYPKEVCSTSNCVFVKSAKTCREETRSLVQNIPSEDCDLEPRETCKLETVLVPRLVEKPNCVQVPKEICVEVKTNPRKELKPVLKEWCYRPTDFRAKSTKQALDLVLNEFNE